MIKRIALFAVGTLIGLALLFGGVWVYRTYIAPPPLRGVAIESPRPAYDFQLQSGGDQTVRLSQFRGKVVALYFGYTFCPDVCPTTMAESVQWRQALGLKPEQLRTIFVTVDPARDTMDALKTYLTTFDPAIIGLVGTPAQTDAAKASFGVFSENGTPDASGFYTVNHTANVFLIGADGQFKGTIAYGEATDTALAKIKRLIAG